MKRRELIKSGLIVAGISAIGIAAPKTGIDIVPKQTDIYKISRPMPFDLKKIDEIVEQNKKAEKYQIKTLYNSYPAPLSRIFNEEFQTSRGVNTDIKSFEDFAKYATYSMKNGFDFVYTLNSPKPFLKDDYYKNKKKLFNLLDNLQAIGCNALKIANQQLMEVISREKHFNFDFHVSTSSEYHNIQQYTTLIKTYPNIKSINISIDDNRNFHLLRSLRKLFPDVELEILVNETCIHGCPSRIIHPSTNFCFFDCIALENDYGALECFFKSNVIYPWQLAYYSAIGINTFKVMLADRGKEQKHADDINCYLNCVENGTGDIPAADFFDKVMSMRHRANLDKTVKLSEIMPYLPDIRHFVKNGYKCSSICGSECNYCMDCCKKIKEIMLIS